MAGARHALPGIGRARRVANAACIAVVGVGVTVLVLGERASGYADVVEPSSAVLTVGVAVVPNGLFPGAVVTGHLPVSNAGPYDAQVTRVAFGATVVDAAHRACDPASVALSAASLPVVPGAAGQRIPFTVTMSPAAVNACQGATFTSSYTVSARPA
jgi:hypothetical protein